MKRSKLILDMERAYAIRHVMVESGYITVKQFMEEILELVQDRGMLPPRTKLSHLNCEDNSWDPEESQNETNKK
jgi:hypothetical protein